MNINNKSNHFIFYGLTPPKKNTDEEKVTGIAQRQINRIKELNIDGVILYDIQDESSRIDVPRPFPYMETIPPEEYSNKYLTELTVPKIIYQSIGKYSSETLKKWFTNHQSSLEFTVLVGAPSRNHKTGISLKEAYQIRKEMNISTSLGGVTIPERHFKKDDEHHRIFHKMDQGCSFFISQCVYSIHNIKNFLSDYYFYAKEHNKNLAPIIFTLTPCGSKKTLSFLEWLGIDIPKWLKNDLFHSEDILSKSVESCKNIAIELKNYCQEKEIPFGFNIESVAIRKEEIDASIELLKFVQTLLKS